MCVGTVQRRETFIWRRKCSSGGDNMTRTVVARVRYVLVRGLAVVAAVMLYAVSTVGSHVLSVTGLTVASVSGLTLITTTTPADARRRRRRRRRRRGGRWFWDWLDDD